MYVLENSELSVLVLDQRRIWNALWIALLRRWLSTADRYAHGPLLTGLMAQALPRRLRRSKRRIFCHSPWRRAPAGRRQKWASSVWEMRTNPGEQPFSVLTGVDRVPAVDSGGSSTAPSPCAPKRVPGPHRLARRHITLNGRNLDCAHQIEHRAVACALVPASFCPHGRWPPLPLLNARST
ncbi:MAG: hypothetical protein R2873_07980 [Caldilineaceae bacterium]